MYAQTATAPQLACFALLDAAVARYKTANAVRQPKPWKSTQQRYNVLAALGCFWKQELDDTSLAGRNRLLYRLECGCQLEARRARNGHHGYELSRHRNMIGARDAERLAIDALAQRRSV